MVTTARMTDLGPEHVAYWYLRLNGYLTTGNFVVHPDRGSNQRTDIDVLGVRFPHRAENEVRPMRDDSRVVTADDRVHLVVAEAKRGMISFNTSLIDHSQENIYRVLRAVGITNAAQSLHVAADLHRTGRSLTDGLRVTLLGFGERRSDVFATTLPDALQLVWTDVLTFIFDRFRAYRTEKRSHGQWDAQGRLLWELSLCDSAEDFAARVRLGWETHRGDRALQPSVE